MTSRLFSLPRFSCLVLLGLFVQGIAQANEEVTGSGYLRGKFVWVDLMTRDPDAAMAFYGKLFDWQFESRPDGTNIALNHGRKVGGVVFNNRPVTERSRSQWVSFISVADPDAVASSMKEQGGKVLVDPLDIDGRGRLAIFVTPDGAIIGVINSVLGDPPDDPIAPGEFGWFELWSTDVAGSAQFYDYARYEVLSNPGPDGADNFLLVSSGAVRAGIVHSHEEQKYSAWLPYILVDSVKEAIAKTIALGGSQLSLEGVPNSNYALSILADPTGGVFAVFEDVNTAVEVGNEE